MAVFAGEIIATTSITEGGAGFTASGEILVIGASTKIINVIAAVAPPSASVSASLSNLTSTTQATASFGQDVACFPDLDPRLGLLAGQPNLTQAILHRLQTKRGLLAYALNDGYDVRAFLNEGANLANGGTLGQIQQAIETEVEKDERVDSCSAQVLLDPVAQVMTINLSINTRTGVNFTLVLGVGSVGLTLLQGN